MKGARRLLPWAGLLAALGCAALLGLASLRQAGQAQAAAREAEAAQWLAWALSRQPLDEAAQRALLDEEFSRGRITHLRLTDAQGRPLYERRAEGAPSASAAASAADAPPGSAPVVEGQRVVGRLQVRLAAQRADGDVADARLTLLLGLLVLGAVGALAIAVGRQRARLDLARLSAQANALAQGEPPGPGAGLPGIRSPALAGVSQGLARVGERIQALQQERQTLSNELSRLREVDALTGLYDRAAFLSRLQVALAPPARPGRTAGSLLLLRLRHLDAMNLRVGHDAVDGLLQSVAAMAGSYPARVPGAFAGRLNGGDFALYLPAPDVALDTAQALWAALRSALLTVDAAADLAIGGAEGLAAGPASHALAAADQALAQAESQGRFPIVVLGGGRGPAAGEARADAAAGPAAAGAAEVAARQRIAQALDRGDIRLAERPVLAPGGALLQLDCRLQYRENADSAWQEMTGQLLQGARSRLTQRVDLSAMARALEAGARDGTPRAVRVAMPSLAEPGFVSEGQRLLQAHGGASRCLRVEVAADVAAAHPRWIDAVAPWADAGVRFGLDGPAADLSCLGPAVSRGLEYVRRSVGPAVEEVEKAGPAEEGDPLAGWVAAVHAAGLRVYADGVDTAQALNRLGQAGFDGLCGAAVG